MSLWSCGRFAHEANLGKQGDETSAELSQKISIMLVSVNYDFSWPRTHACMFHTGMAAGVSTTGLQHFPCARSVVATRKTYLESYDHVVQS